MRVENLHLWWCLADNWLGEEVKENIYTQGWDGGVPMHSCWAEYQNILMIEIFNLLIVVDDDQLKGYVLFKPLSYDFERPTRP